MKVGVPREIAQGERRVALVPEAVARLDGFDVVVEQGAGIEAGFVDEAYVDAGAAIGDPWSADIVVKVGKPSAEEAGRILRIEPVSVRVRLSRARTLLRQRVTDGD